MYYYKNILFSSYFAYIVSPFWMVKQSSPKRNLKAITWVTHYWKGNQSSKINVCMCIYICRYTHPHTHTKGKCHELNRIHPRNPRLPSSSPMSGFPFPWDLLGLLMKQWGRNQEKNELGSWQRNHFLCSGFCRPSCSYKRQDVSIFSQVVTLEAILPVCFETYVP